MPNNKEIDRVIAQIDNATEIAYNENDSISTRMSQLKRLSRPFGMDFYSLTKMVKKHYGKTPCCIAGWACATPMLENKNKFEIKNYYDISIPDIAAEVLGLDAAWAWRNLFWPHLDELPIVAITKKQAITALTRIKEAGDGYNKLNKFDLWC